VPTRGSLVTASLENAPGSLGSQIRFVRVFGQARHFRSWRSVVLASAFQGGNVSPLGGQDVISTERFFTGGSTSIRGVPEDSAGERDFFGPVGGRVLLLLNQEVRFPLNRFLQGVAFVDAGNVFKEPREVSFGRLTTSVGLGLRVVTPFALLRVDYGQVVRGVAAGDPRARWIFGIGHAF
jgi:outer membrane protein assembly factor BamA